MTKNPPTTWELLNQLNNEELKPLVDDIKKASVTENLTISDAYKKHYPNHKKYIKEIYREIRLFGGNTFANLFRGDGPPYLEVLEDVAKKIGVKNTKNVPFFELEHLMLEELLRKALKEAKGSEKVELEAMLKKSGLSDKDLSAFLSGGTLVALIGASAYNLLLTRAATVIASAVAKQLLGYGLSMGAAFSVQRMGAMWLGPIGIAVAGIWTAIDIGGPAFRVTIPCVLHIAMLRQQWVMKKNVDAMKGGFDE